jgi:hypothetical protein
MQKNSADPENHLSNIQFQGEAGGGKTWCRRRVQRAHQACKAQHAIGQTLGAKEGDVRHDTAPFGDLALRRP